MYMKRIKNILLFVLLCGLVLQAPFAKTIAVNSSQKISDALTSAASGDVIELDDGVYYECIDIKKSIILKAKNAGKATITNKHKGAVSWTNDKDNIYYADNISWPVHYMLIDGGSVWNYRKKSYMDQNISHDDFIKQGTKSANYTPGFAWDSSAKRIWLRSNTDPNKAYIELNGADLDAVTYFQKDFGTRENQQTIWECSQTSPDHPLLQDYDGRIDTYDWPKICGIIVEVNADNVTLEGLRLHVAPTVCLDINDSKNLTVRDCFFSGYWHGLNTGYMAESTTVEYCEFDGGQVGSLPYGQKASFGPLVTGFVCPVLHKGSGIFFRHNYVYEGFDGFQPRGIHKDYLNRGIRKIQSDVSYNIWQKMNDNNLEFDGVEYHCDMRFHHNLSIDCDKDNLAITSTENTNGGILTIDHNIFWPANGRIMKLAAGDKNSGVWFIHNTYFGGKTCVKSKFEGDSRFENNLFYTEAAADCWSENSVGLFFPNKYNCIWGSNWNVPLNADPKLGATPETRFVLQQGSPAIDAGKVDASYYQNNVKDGKPDLGALEANETIDDWAKAFGHCGPRWIDKNNASVEAPYRTAWPQDIDRRWGGTAGSASDIVSASVLKKGTDSQSIKIRSVAQRSIEITFPSREIYAISIISPSGRIVKSLSGEFSGTELLNCPLLAGTTYLVRISNKSVSHIHMVILK